MSNHPDHNGPVNKEKLVTDLQEQLHGLDYDATVPENSASQNWRIAEEREGVEEKLESVLATPAEAFATDDTVVETDSPAPAAEKDERSYRDEIDYNEDGSPNVMAPKE